MLFSCTCKRYRTCGIIIFTRKLSYQRGDISLTPKSLSNGTALITRHPRYDRSVTCKLGPDFGSRNLPFFCDNGVGVFDCWFRVGIITVDNNTTAKKNRDNLPRYGNSTAGCHFRGTEMAWRLARTGAPLRSTRCRSPPSPSQHSQKCFRGCQKRYCRSLRRRTRRRTMRSKRCSGLVRLEKSWFAPLFSHGRVSEFLNRPVFGDHSAPHGTSNAAKLVRPLRRLQPRLLPSVCTFPRAEQAPPIRCRKTSLARLP